MIRPALGTTTAAAIAAALLLSGCAGSESGTPSAPEPAAAEERAGVSSATIEAGWAKAAEATGMTGLFGTLRNEGSEDLIISSVESDAAEMAELHEVTADGVMQEIAGDVVIPAGGTLELAPGADHIMLMGLTRDLLAGDDVSVTVTFENGKTAELTVPVKDYAGANEEYAGAEDHGEHGGH